MSRTVEIAVDEFYHVYNRGVEKRDIFLNNQDRERFLALLYLCNSVGTFHLSDLKEQKKDLTLGEILATDIGERLVDIGVYCLMPNHFHLLVRERREGGLSLFMQKLTTGYTMYFNKRRQRRGALLEGTFKLRHAGDDHYLHYLFAYIHLNPVKISDPTNWEQKVIPDPGKALQFLNNYHYSSFLDYTGQRRAERSIISPTAFPEYFAVPQEFTNFIKDWAEYEE